MNEFLNELNRILRAEPFLTNQSVLAKHTGVDQSLLSRILKGQRDPTPEIVGRLCGTLPASDGALLLAAFLRDVAAATSRAKPHENFTGRWRSPAKELSVRIDCKATR